MDEFQKRSFSLTTYPNGTDGLRRPIKYRPDIDGLRALAITSVVACHIGLGWAKGGFVGVDVFFVISGYLIGSLVYKEIRGQSFHLAKFYARRAKRIVPALFAILIFSYALAVLLLPPTDLISFSASALATIASSSNIYFWRSVGYFDTTANLSPLLMTWSLGIEEQFYLLFPMLMLLMRKMQWQTQLMIVAGLTALSLAASILGTANHALAAYYLLPTRASELAAGVLLAILEANRPNAKESFKPAAAHGLGLLGLGLIIWAILRFDDTTAFPGYAALLPVSGAVLIIASRQGVVNQALAWRPIVFVGLISYSWYLWHWPLLSFAHIVLDTGISQTIGLAIAVLSFVCAVLSYRFIEQPFRAYTTAAPLLLSRYAIVLVVLAAPAAVFYGTHGLPQRSGAMEAADLVAEQFSKDSCLVDLPEVHPPLHAPCVPPGQGRAVVLIGDSHGAALAGGLRAISEHSGYRLIELTKAGCPALDGVSPGDSYIHGFQEMCSEFNRECLYYIDQDPSIQVVVIAALWAAPFQGHLKDQGYAADGEKVRSFNETRSLELLQSGLDRFVTQLEQNGKTVYLVLDNPRFLFNPSQVILNRQNGLRRILTRSLAKFTPVSTDDVAPEFDPEDTQKARMIVITVAGAHPGTRLIDLHRALCGAGGCRFADGNQVFFLDDNHLSPLGAQVSLAGLKLP